MYFKYEEQVQKITSMIYKTSSNEIRQLTRLVFVINGTTQEIKLTNKDIDPDIEG